MPSKRRFTRTATGCAFAVTVVLSLGGFSSAQASIPGISPTPQPSAPKPPSEPKVRALTAAEIRGRGLDRYIDMSDQKEITPTLTDSPRNKSATDVPAPTRKPSKSGDGGLASGCWSLETYDSAALAGIGYHTWCGDGARITHISTSCAGRSSPNHVYWGCISSSNHGTGWNVWDVMEKWRFCTSYDSSTGACATRANPWQKNRYGADGQVWLLESGNQ